MRAYSITPQIMIDTGRAHFRETYSGSKLVFALGYCILVGLGVAYVSDTASWPAFMAYAFGMTVVGILIFAIIFAILYYWQIPRQARANHAMQPAFTLPYHVHWDDQELTLSSDKNHTTDAFGDFVYWLRAGSHLMLYRNKMLYNVIAADAFETPQECEELIARLDAAGVKQR